MSIHSEIRRLRKLKGWSMDQLAIEVSKAEGLTNPLNWQTVQQWEREPGGKGKSTAPTRSRLETVARLLGTTPAALLAGVPAQPTSVDDLSGQEGVLLGLFRALSADDRAFVLHEVRERAAHYSVPSRKDRDAA